MTDNDTLRTLWELLDEGRHKAWAKEVERMDDGTFVLCLPDTNHDSYADLDDRLLVAILRDRVEGWLVGMDWIIEKWQYNGKTCVEYRYDYRGEMERKFDTLIDAVRYAREQDRECPASANGRNM